MTHHGYAGVKTPEMKRPLWMESTCSKTPRTNRRLCGKYITSLESSVAKGSFTKFMNALNQISWKFVLYLCEWYEVDLVVILQMIKSSEIR